MCLQLGFTSSISLALVLSADGILLFSLKLWHLFSKNSGKIKYHHNNFQQFSEMLLNVIRLTAVKTLEEMSASFFRAQKEGIGSFFQEVDTLFQILTATTSYHTLPLYRRNQNFCIYRCKSLISDFRRYLNIVYFLLGISPASNCSWPTFRNPVLVPSSKAGCRV